MGTEQKALCETCGVKVAVTPDCNCAECEKAKADGTYLNVRGLNFVALSDNSRVWCLKFWLRKFPGSEYTDKDKQRMLIGDIVWFLSQLQGEAAEARDAMQKSLS